MDPHFFSLSIYGLCTELLDHTYRPKGKNLWRSVTDGTDREDKLSTRYQHIQVLIWKSHTNLYSKHDKILKICLVTNLCRNPCPTVHWWMLVRACFVIPYTVLASHQQMLELLSFLKVFPA